MPSKITAGLSSGALLRTRGALLAGAGVLACVLLAGAWVSHHGHAPAPAGIQGAHGTAAVQPHAAAPPAAAQAKAASHATVADARTGPDVSSDVVTVRRNDTLGGIFRRLKLSLTDLAAIRNLPAAKGRLIDLHPGDVLKFKHRGAQLVGLQRKLSATETLEIVRRKAGFHAQVLTRPLDSHERTVSGVIHHSLFAAVTAAGAHDSTATQLADIFAWDVDFALDIRAGDSFTVTYAQLTRDGHYVKDGPILAARFVNRGHEYLAVRYVGPDGQAHYYTPDGHSLRKAFLRAPLKYTRVSSKFNMHRYHPILHRIRPHDGVDYAAPMGTPVDAAGDGRVKFKGRQRGYGNVIELDHSHGIVTVYAHLSRFAKGLHVGESVTQGEVIGYVGMTGLATGPHLHYEYRVNGVFKNPQTVQLPQGKPISAQLMSDFRAKTRPLLASLDTPVGPALVSR